MSPKNIVVPVFVLAACVLMCACTTVDRFTVHELSNDPGYQANQSPAGSTPGRISAANPGAQMATIRTVDEDLASLEKQPLVLKERCQYRAGSDISGSLSPGPLQPDAIGIPAPSNSHIKKSIYLIHIADVQTPGGHDLASFIGVQKNGAFVSGILLHSDMPGAEPFAVESAKIRFTPKSCHYSMQSANAHDGRT